MFSRNNPRKYFAHVSTVMICALALLTSSFYFVLTSGARESLPMSGLAMFWLSMSWVAVALFGGGLLLILGWRAYWHSQLTITRFVSEATSSSPSNTFVDSRHWKVDLKQEARESELALLQMTLGPRVF